MFSFASTAALLAGVLSGTVVVVCPGPWQKELAPWVAKRTAEGHRVLVLRYRGEEAEELAGRIRPLLQRSGQAGYVLLVGDPSPQAAAGEHEPATPKGRREPGVPVFYRASRVVPGVKLIATDAPYGDLDRDGCPDVAVGRWSVTNTAELRAVVAKTLAAAPSDKLRNPGPEQLVFWAGHGGFGAVTDRVIQTCTRMVLAGELPPECPITLIPAQWRAGSFRGNRSAKTRPQSALRFWVYMGHGLPWALRPWPGREWEAASLLRAGSVAPRATLAVLFCCEAGMMDQGPACLAEQLLRHPQGPAAVLAGSRITMPYGMAVLGRGLLQHHFAGTSPQQENTLGRIFLAAQRRAFHREDNPQHDPTARIIDQAARWLNIHPHLKRERREHVWLFNLLGDPTLSLPRVPRMELQVPQQPTAGGLLVCRLRSPRPGRVTLELYPPLGEAAAAPQPGSDNPARASSSQGAGAEKTASDVVVFRRRCLFRRHLARKIAPDEVNAWVQVQTSLEGVRPGRYTLLLRVQGEQGQARGWTSVRVAPAKPAAATMAP